MALATLDQNIPHERTLYRRISSIIANPPDTEFSLYGPYALLWHKYFPFAAHWMVKPQAPIRRFVPGHGSQDSVGRTVDPDGRTAKRPDFTICRFGEDGNSDATNIIIEIKPKAVEPNTAEFDRASSQLGIYMLMLNEQLPAAKGGEGVMVGLLILGTICFSFRVAGNLVVQTPQDLDVRGVDVRWPAFRTFLLARAAIPNLPPP
ncbi:hypothetical protein FRC09_020321 [Ceratobasidium sp. 395]|nr:hypothetical protein FRC09_020321 [Ceratobasidium sp. 395]